MSRRLYEVTRDFEVPFHDVDALRIVWHGHYYKYMELGRTALLRDRGIDVPEIGPNGYRLLLVESRCRYTFPLRYGDQGRVHAWFAAAAADDRLPHPQPHPRPLLGARPDRAGGAHARGSYAPGDA